MMSETNAMRENGGAKYKINDVLETRNNTIKLLPVIAEFQILKYLILRIDEGTKLIAVIYINNLFENLAKYNNLMHRCKFNNLHKLLI